MPLIQVKVSPFQDLQAVGDVFMGHHPFVEPELRPPDLPSGLFVFGHDRGTEAPRPCRHCFAASVAANPALIQRTVPTMA
jgi:hypothetical protein